MRLRTALRISPGAWLTSGMVGLVALYVAQSITFAHREPYTLGLTARAMNVLGLVVPVFAAAATWEGLRWTQSGVWALPFVRHRVSVAAWSISPAISGGALVIVIAAIQVLSYDGLLLPDASIIMLALALLGAHTLCGFAIGVTWSHVAAVPLVTLASFASFVLPRVIEPASLLHPFGASLELCCTNDQVLAPEVAGSILVVALGLSFASVVAISRRPLTRSLRATCVGVVVLSVTAAAMIASPVPMSPTIARPDDADACMDGANIRVCAWPEHAALLPATVAVADRAVTMWSASGFRTPRLVTEAPQGAASDSVTVDLWTRADPRGIVGELAWGLIPEAPSCAATEPWPAAAATDYLWAWLALTGGYPRTEMGWYLGDHIPDETLYPDAPPESLVPIGPLLDTVLALPSDAQARWAAGILAAMDRCSVLAPLTP